MNAKQAEQVTGISRRNLRFYEQQGLIHPVRNPDNDYRDYSDSDLEDLKTIRVLRMLDVSLEAIGSVLDHSKTLKQVMADQEEILTQKQEELKTAIDFCRELQKVDSDVDDLLKRMDAPQVKRHLFADWIKDYQMVEKSEAKRAFSFAPDGAVTNAREFTDALFRYGSENNLNLVVTKEGMNPEFTIDGIAYSAERIYRAISHIPIPVAVIYCTVQDPELIKPDLPTKKRRAMAAFRNWWPILIFIIPEIVALITTKAFFWEFILMILATAALWWGLLFWTYRIK